MVEVFKKGVMTKVLRDPAPAPFPEHVLVYGNFDIILGPSLALFRSFIPLTPAVCCDLLSAHADRLLTGACNPMVRPMLPTLDLGLIHLP